MTETSQYPPPPDSRTSPAHRRRVVLATIVGTAIEWYDFFLYAAAAGIVFAELFFAPAGRGFGTILAFLTVGLSFLFRPLGAFLAGHLGDRYGRKLVLLVTLVMMGVSTTLIGVLPTHADIGIAAPVLLVVLRVLQGISAGGEWGGAALLAVEHAPPRRRGLFGAFPQVGVPIGLLLSSGVLALMTRIAPGEAFLEWGWRVPFLLSVVLIVAGVYIRRRVEESPVFEALVERKARPHAPIAALFRKHPLLLIVAGFVPVASQAVGYMTTGGYIQRYATDPTGPLRLPTGEVLWAVTGSAVTWLVFTLVGGLLSDRIGRRRTFFLAWGLLFVAVLAMFPLVNTGNVGLLFLGLAFLTVGLGLANGPLAALLAEMFPTSVRLSGASIAYAIGAIAGGAFAPTIATALVQATGTTSSVTIYLIVMVGLSTLAILLLKDRSGIGLGPENEAEQSVSPLRGRARAVRAQTERPSAPSRS
ncbi:MFS transporter [Amycolatopsis thermophila]|uniref:MFS family permease n=1 Tax=Amycolatopsis thermophila TaxID=206084 RepID=A0ABU0EYB8_9PSEU|nr:MFS transporter [Amycolatopsis thermophila]MDQ0380311.1 MFS family permease [Amycolatopsis thermophila]